MTILQSDVLTVSVLHKGAELSSVRNTSGLEYLWQADAAVWPRHAPVLFPIVGKLKDNRFHYQGNSYSLSQHGFARDCDFKLLESTANSCLFELRSNPKTRDVYPFDFALRVAYTLEGHSLRTTYTVDNPSQNPLLFSIGAHPGFRCPLEEGERFEDYYLEFENSDYRLSSLREGLRDGQTKPLHLTNNKLYLSETLFNQDALVFEGGQIQRIRLCSSKSSRCVTLRSSNWPYFGIWSKTGCREFVCLEPWYGIADRADTSQDLASKEGILSLTGQKQFSCSFDLSFE